MQPLFLLAFWAGAVSTKVRTDCRNFGLRVGPLDGMSRHVSAAVAEVSATSHQGAPPGRASQIKALP